MRFSDLRKILKGRPVVFSVQIVPVEFSRNPKHRDGFLVHFHRRKGWTPFGFQKTINTTYVLTRKHSFKVFQLLNRRSVYVTFDMHSNYNWIISFMMNWYVKHHI
jgi:hypothetical protein